jgi:hypothetical protein
MSASAFDTALILFLFSGYSIALCGLVIFKLSGEKKK